MSSMLKLEATNSTVCGFIVAVFIFAEHNPLDTSIMSSVMSSWFVFSLLLAPFPSIPKERPVQQALSSKMAFELLTLTRISWHPNSDKAASKAVDFPVSDSPMATGIGQQPYASLPLILIVEWLDTSRYHQQCRNEVMLCHLLTQCIQMV